MGNLCLHSSHFWHNGSTDLFIIVSAQFLGVFFSLELQFELRTHTGTYVNHQYRSNKPARVASSLRLLLVVKTSLGSGGLLPGPVQTMIKEPDNGPALMDLLFTAARSKSKTYRGRYSRDWGIPLTKPQWLLGRQTGFRISRVSESSFVCYCGEFL